MSYTPINRKGRKDSIELELGHVPVSSSRRGSITSASHPFLVGGGGASDSLPSSSTSSHRNPHARSRLRSMRFSRRILLLAIVFTTTAVVWFLTPPEPRGRISGYVQGGAAYAQQQAGKAWNKANGWGSGLLGGPPPAPIVEQPVEKPQVDLPAGADLPQGPLKPPPAPGQVEEAPAAAQGVVNPEAAQAEAQAAALEQSGAHELAQQVKAGGAKAAAAAVEATQDDLLASLRQRPAPHPDAGKTTKCMAASPNSVDYKGKARPTVQYGIMIDAGSTGSRVHVYKFNFCAKSPELESEVFHAIQGGLSSFGANAKGAADSLRPLLKIALDNVPKNLQACTPISVKATAGLRLLGPAQSQAILAEVRRMLTTEFPFAIADGRKPGEAKGIEIMQGRDEGVYAWITVNYLLGRIGDAAGANKPTAAVMDLGGASTQIVFEPLRQSTDQGMRPGEHVYEVKDFGGRDFTLYQNSYLGYGLMQARRSINALATFTYAFTHPDAVRMGPDGSNPAGAAAAAAAGAKGVAGVATTNVWDASHKIPSPCFAEGTSKAVKVGIPGVKDDVEVTLVGTSGGFEACSRLVQVMMNKDAVCSSPPCSFAGVYQPSLMTSFQNSPIVALSYFYDRLTPLGLGPTFTISQLESAAKRVCASPSTWSQSFSGPWQAEALALLKDKPEACLDLSFMHALLSLGYELDGERKVTTIKQLDGMELGWALGAQLAVLEEMGVECKA